MPLYPSGATAPLGLPESRRARESGGALVFNVSEPTLEVFRPLDHANGTAVIVVPGGGFVGLDYEAGGTDIARSLTQHGVTAFVLKYRTIQSAGDPAQLPAVHRKEMEGMMARAKSGRPLEAPRNLLKVPGAILDRLKTFDQDDVVAATVKLLQPDDMAAFASLGLALNGDELTAPDPALPNPEAGKYSRANIFGMEKVRRDRLRRASSSRAPGRETSSSTLRPTTRRSGPRYRSSARTRRCLGLWPW